MSELQIAWLELITVGGLGIILALAGVIINIIAKRQNKLCTQHTEGIVIQYGFPGDGRMYPIVEYFVDGVCYKAKKKFRGVKRIRISGLPIKVQSKAYEGPIANLHQIAEQLWPIGSKMTVFYNPNDPKKCYVDRPISGSFTSIMFVLVGMVIIILSILVFFLIQL